MQQTVPRRRDSTANTLRARVLALRVSRLLFLAACAVGVPGCYYVQAARGQLEVMQKREPIADVLDAGDTSTELGRRLRLVDQARRFSIEVLKLPDNDSYRTYSDIERDYVVWNVFAAPEFSLEPKRWCFPIVGCVSYRGYFEEDAARRQARRLREQGFDVSMGGVAAYSTLGRFDDPVLSTMLRWDDVHLVATMFHELAHQVVYVKGDTAFNESFATAVEEAGIERWLTHRGNSGDLENYRERQALSHRIMQLVEAARRDLGTYYSETIDPDEKRLLKQDRLERLAADIDAAYRRTGRNGPAWLTELNNARIASMMLYEGLLPAFRQLLDGCGGDFACFYAEASALAELDEASRDANLAQLANAG